MRRALTLILGCALFGIMAAVVVASQGADDPANHDSTTTGTVEQRTKTTEDHKARERRHDDAKDKNEDVRGPRGNDDQADDNGGRVDNAGPGSQNSGPGSVNSGRDDTRGEAEPNDDRGGQGEVEPGD